MTRNQEMKILHDHGMSYKEMSKKYGISSQRCQQICEKKVNNNDLGLSNTTYSKLCRWLQRDNITLETLVKLTEKGFYVYDIGLRGMREIAKITGRNVVIITYMNGSNKLKFE